MDRHRAHRFRPALETLENRYCPAAGIVVIGHTMIVQGDADANDVTITDDGNGNISATLTGLNVWTSKDGTGINYVIVNTKGGNDTVTYTLNGDLTSSLALAVDLGAFQDGTGNTNSVDFNFSGYTVKAPYLAVGVLGTLGTDKVTAEFGAITDSYVALGAALGGNDDSFTATLSGALSGDADVYLGAYGGFGKDTLKVDATADVTIDSNAELAVLLDGGWGDDTINFDYKGE